MTSRAEYLATHSANRTKPWIALGKSKATYYRDRARERSRETSVSANKITSKETCKWTHLSHLPDGTGAAPDRLGGRLAEQTDGIEVSHAPVGEERRASSASAPDTAISDAERLGAPRSTAEVPIREPGARQDVMGAVAERLERPVLHGEVLPPGERVNRPTIVMRSGGWFENTNKTWFGGDCNERADNHRQRRRPRDQPPDRGGRELRPQ